VTRVLDVKASSTSVTLLLNVRSYSKTCSQHLKALCDSIGRVSFNGSHAAHTVAPFERNKMSYLGNLARVNIHGPCPWQTIAAVPARARALQRLKVTVTETLSTKNKK
jgi:hypothetical protein